MDDSATTRLEKGKERQKALYRAGGIGLLVGLFVALCVIGVWWSSQRESSDKTQIDSISPDNKVAAVLPTSGSWCAVTLIDNEQYYGRVKTDDTGEYYIVWDVYRPSLSVETTGSLQLVAAGSEIHEPEPYMVIPVSSLKGLQALSLDSSLIKIITEAPNYEPVEEPSSVTIRDNRKTAFFLTDGAVLFGDLVAEVKGFTGIRNAYYLARKDDSGLREIRSLDDLELVPQASKSLGLDGVYWVNNQSLVMYQPLTPESRITQAILDSYGELESQNEQPVGGIPANN